MCVRRWKRKRARSGEPRRDHPDAEGTMNGYNFTERVRKVLAMAREEAARLHHEYVGTEHILLGLIREGEGVAATVLQNLSVDLDEIQQKIEETVKKGKAGADDRPRSSLYLAREEGARARHERGARAQPQLRRHRASPARPSPRREGDCGAGSDRRGRQSRRRARGDAAPPRHRDAAGRARSSAAAAGAAPPQPPKGEKKSKTPALDHFCRDLTQLAAEGQLDPTIGRAKEIQRVMEVLTRRKKNNPVLIGEPASARRRSSRDSRSSSRTASAPSRCATIACCRSTWRRSSPAPSIAVSSRSASRRS